MPRGFFNPNFNVPEIDDPEESIDLTPIQNALESLKVAIKSNKGQKEVSVDNLDEIKAHLRNELGLMVKQLKPLIESVAEAIPEPPKSVEVSNFPKPEAHPEEISVKNLSELGDLLQELILKVEGLNVSPVVNVPAPIVNVPPQSAPIVNVPPQLPQLPVDLSPILAKLDPLKLLSRDPNKPITVRLSDGRSFVDAITKVLEDGGNKLATVVSTSYGLTQDEYRTVTRESSGLEIPRHDYMTRVLSGAAEETYTYRLGGVTGAIQAIVVVTYTDATLDTILNVSRV